MYVNTRILTNIFFHTLLTNFCIVGYNLADAHDPFNCSNCKTLDTL